MKKEQFKLVISAVFDKIKDLTETKGEEYTGHHTDDQLANFKRNSGLVGVKPTTIWSVYFMKHIDAIMNFVRNEERGRSYQASEPIIGRIDDAILYLILLRAMVQEKREEQEIN